MPAKIGELGTAAHDGTAQTTDVITVTANVSVGDFILVYGSSHGQSLSGVTDSQGNVYAIAQNMDNAGSVTGSIAYCSGATHALTSGVDTITCTWAASVTGGNVTAENFSGANGYVLDQHNSGTGNVAAWTTPSVTTLFPNEILASCVAVAAGGSSETNTPTSPWVGDTKAVATDGNRAVLPQHDFENQGTYAGGGTLGTAQTWCSAIATFGPATTGENNFTFEYPKPNARKNVGPMVFRMQRWTWEGRNWEILPDPQNTYWPPIQIPNPHVGPPALRRRWRHVTAWDVVQASNIFNIVSASDTLDALTDVATRALQSFTRTASDAIASYTETVTRFVAFIRTATDTFDALTDTATRSAQNFVRTASDSIASYSETATRALQAFVRSATDTIASYSETVTRFVAFVRSAADTFDAYSETATMFKVVIRSASDTIASYSETATRALQSFSRTATDTISSYTETATRAAQAFARTASDTIAAYSETVTMFKVVIRSATDTIASYSETATRSAQAFARTATDTITSLSETATRAAQAFTRNASDTISAFTDTATRSAQSFARNAIDILSALSETVSRSLSLPRTASDTIASFTETATRAAQHFTRSASETLSSLIDHATAFGGGALTVFISFAIYGRSGILKVTGRAGTFAVYGRNGALKVLGRTGIMKLFGRRGQ